MPKKTNVLEHFVFIPSTDWAGLAGLYEDQESLDEESMEEKYHVDHLLKSGAIISARDFFQDGTPIVNPFTVLTHDANYDFVTISRDVRDSVEILNVNEAAEGRSPFLWSIDDHYSGWLLGSTFWELTRSEFGYPDDEQKLLLMDAADKDRRKFERLRNKFNGVPSDQYNRIKVPEHVRIFVWRRDGGKCIECGAKNSLEYDHVIPVSKGGSNTERNIQLLCESCNRSKSDKI